MNQNILFSLCMIWVIGLCMSCKTQQAIGKDVKASADLPIITFEQDTIHLGTLIEGEKRSLVYQFTNTGRGTLQIDLASACKCTSLDWPSDPIEPGGGGEITVEFDSMGFRGEVLKTIDIIGNTDPIVVEAWFTATVNSK